jgi:hypothetical protein
MILISHRGNLNGPNPERENSPEYIDEAIKAGYDVEIDIWLNDGILYLGHDSIQYQTSHQWLKNRKDKLWIHCKNIEAIETLSFFGHDYHYFWHQEDTLTLTSKNIIWVYPGKQSIQNSIAVMPEIYNDNLDHCMGVCSDYIQNYK